MGDNKMFGLSQTPIGGNSQFLLTADASHNGDVAYEQHFLNVYVAAAKPKLCLDVGEATNESSISIRSTRKGGDLLIVGIADAFGGGTGSLFADYAGRKLAEAAETLAGRVKSSATNAIHQVATQAFSEVADAIKGSKMGFDTLTSICHSALIFKRGATLSIYSAGSLSIVAAGVDLWGKAQTRVLIGPQGRGPATAEKVAGFVPASGYAGGAGGAAAADGASRPLGGEALGAGSFQLSSTSLTLQPTDAVIVCVTGVDWELFFPEELGLMAFRALAGGLDAGSAALKVASEVEERARLLGTEASEGLQCTCLIIVNPAANGIGRNDAALGPASSMNSTGRPSATPALTNGSRSSGASGPGGLSNGPGSDAKDAGGKRGILGWIKTRLNKKDKKEEGMNREAMAVLKEASVHRGARPSAAMASAQNRPNRLGSHQGGAQDYSTRRGSAGYPSAAALAPARNSSVAGGRMEARRSSLGMSGAGGAAPNAAAASPPVPIATRGAASPLGLHLTDSPSPVNLYRGVNSVNEYTAPRRMTGAILETARGSAGANTNEPAGKQGLRRTSLGAPRATGGLADAEDNGALLNSYLDKEKARTASKKRLTLDTASRVASITFGASRPKRDAISGTGAAVGGPSLSGKANTNANYRPGTETGGASAGAVRSANAYTIGSYGSPERIPSRSTNGLGPGGNLVLTPDAVQAFTAIVKIDEEPFAVIRGGTVSNPAAPPRRSSVGFRLPGEGVKASYRLDLEPALPGTVEAGAVHGSGLDLQMEAAYFNAPPKASRTDNA